MSEIPDTGPMDKGVETLDDVERWIQQTAGVVISTRLLKVGPIRPDMAYAGVRWAALWREDFNMLINMGADAYPQADTTTLMRAARYISAERFDSGVKYPGNKPTIQTTVAAYDAFCLSFGDQMPWASEVLGWDMGAYDPVAKHECKQNDTLQSIAGEMLA